MSLKFEVKIRHGLYLHVLKHMRHAKLHRIDSPAKVWEDGVLTYYRYGRYIS